MTNILFSEKAKSVYGIVIKSDNPLVVIPA